MQNTNNVLYIYLTYFWSLSNLNELFPCYLHGICSLAEKCRTLGSKSCPAHSSDGVVLSSHHAPIFYSTSVARCHSSLACECTRHPATFIQCLHTPPKPRVRHQREYLSNGHSIKCSGVKKKKKRKENDHGPFFFSFPFSFHSSKIFYDSPYFFCMVTSWHSNWSSENFWNTPQQASRFRKKTQNSSD